MSSVIDNNLDGKARPGCVFLLIGYSILFLAIVYGDRVFELLIKLIK